ncbi:hypothetical protein HIM_05148 [Hirsutella minnesotensis 3608]|uniref:Uncharacterized protein n=1 Tax=Hirsutella minnesotensis 3608 TaxID=1043627 RepID=A0A0F8A0L6_9HYPO|nr:hypothetical protein HIM_05148 [Hirsutella minnesotensis 3608]
MAVEEQRQGLMGEHSPVQTIKYDVGQEETPRSLRQSAPSWFWRMGIPSLLLAVPLAYIVLIIMLLVLNTKERSSFGDNVLEVLRVASTIWPISFAAVVGPFLKSAALYSAENGSTLGSLEFLLTSQTSVAALKNLFIIRHIRVWTIAIVVVWCLSPLGGQAATRSLSLEQKSINSTLPAIHYLGGNVSDMNVFYSGIGFEYVPFSGASIQNTIISDMKSAIVASFYTIYALASHSNGSSRRFETIVQALGGPQQAARLGQRDLWRNVRIPFIELLPGYNATERDAWVAVPSDQVAPYASLIGLPIRGGSFPRAGNSTMIVKTHYQTLSCGKDFNGTEWHKAGSTRLLYHNTTSGSKYLNEQYKGLARNKVYPNIFLDIVNDTAAVADHLNQSFYPVTEPATKLELVIGGGCHEDIPEWTWTTMMRICSISTTYIDMEVNCTRLGPMADTNCQAERVRHTPGFPLVGNLTALSSKLTMEGIIWEMPMTTASYHVSHYSNLEMYLQEPPLLIQRRDDLIGNQPGCFSNVPTHVFEARLATALNTFIMGMYNSTVLTGSDGTSLENRGQAWHNGTAVWTEFKPSVYAINMAWFSAWIASTLVLLVCGVTGVYLRCLIKAPDFLDSVVGLTRDSPLIEVSHGGSGISGCDRLQAIKDVKVKICDIMPDEEVGRIALTTRINDSRLRWKRVYS